MERMHPETSDGCVGNNCLRQSVEGPVGAMWFGPRLGRRRRSDAKLVDKKIEALGDVLGSPSWSLITIPGTKFSLSIDKCQITNNFFPRVNISGVKISLFSCFGY